MGSTDIRGSGYHHVAVTLDGSDVRVYVDGHLDGQGEFNNTLSGNGTDDLSFGHSPWASSEYFSGAIDELAIWSRRTSREDIVRIMSENVGVYGDDELIAYWNFNSIDNSIAMDVSANGHDGTLVGDAQITDYIPSQEPIGEEDNFSLRFWGDDGGVDIGTNNFYAIEFV